MTLEEKQAILKQATQDFQSIKKAIVDSGVEVPDGTATEEYAALIGSIGGGDTDAAYSEGYEKGKVDERTWYWERLQVGGKRSTWNSAFGNAAWTDEIYNPIYTFVLSVSVAGQTMYAGSGITDTKVPIDATKTKTTNALFSGAKELKRICELIVSETTCSSLGEYKTWFLNCIALVEINITGVIACTFDIHWSTLLNKESVINIMECLSATATGMTVTFSQTAVDNAFETSEGAADGSTSAEWLALVATRENWTISLG